MSFQNTSDFLECRYFTSEQTALLRQWQFQEADMLPELNRNKGILLYLVSGTIEMALGSFPDAKIGGSQILFLPHNITFYAKAAEKSRFFTCTVPQHIPLCCRYDLLDLQQDIKNLNNGKLPPPEKIPSLTANRRIENFFTELSESFADGLGCMQFHEIKRQELFLMLRAYYPKEELYNLFFPIVSRSGNFREFILKHYKEIGSVSEFASLANMTVRSFQRKFKAEFSCPAREWLIARRAEVILRELRTTEKDLMTIAVENGFSAMSYFTTFCKQHLGMTPSGIRRQRRPVFNDGRLDGSGQDSTDRG